MITYTNYKGAWHVRSEYPLKDEAKVTCKSGGVVTEKIGKCVFYRNKVWIYPIIRETAPVLTQPQRVASVPIPTNGTVPLVFK